MAKARSIVNANPPGVVWPGLALGDGKYAGTGLTYQQWIVVCALTEALQLAGKKPITGFPCSMANPTGQNFESFMMNVFYGVWPDAMEGQQQAAILGPRLLNKGLAGLKGK